MLREEKKKYEYVIKNKKRNSLPATVINEIKDARRKRALTQAELAKRADISRFTVKYLERGYRKTSYKILRKIFSVLEFSSEKVFELIAMIEEDHKVLQKK